jgi:leucyl aminopeptidase
MIEIVPGAGVEEAAGDVLVVPVFEERVWGPGADRVVELLGDWIDDYLEQADFTGKVGQLAAIPGGDQIGAGRVVFAGVGAEADAETLRRVAGNVARAVTRHRTVVTTLHQLGIDGAAEPVTVGFLLGQYRFDAYRSDPSPVLTERLVLAGAGEDVRADIEHGRVVADAVSLARDLVNEPAGAKPPAVLAAHIGRVGEEAGFAVRVYDETECAAERFGGLLGVGAGAGNPPRMVVMRHKPEGATVSLGLVGKGIVFDSGGLSIKPAKGMETMKTDMSGAAAVVGAMQAIARLGLPLEVVGVAPLAENMTGGSAQHPGDVVRIRNGKTIEVLNTDAEGRLVLADGLSLVAEEAPDMIVDVATLTGACRVALGSKVGGVLANDDGAAIAVESAARGAGEKMWRLPLEGEYRKDIDSSVADMKNIGGSYGGAITAALLLAEFVGDIPWAHLDIAGPARAEATSEYTTEGGTGFGVRTLVALAEQLAG